MIKLKSGTEIEYNKNFDTFFQQLLAGIIEEAFHIAKNATSGTFNKEDFNDVLLREIMDNSIFVTQQLFDIAKVNEQMSKFIMSGFLFNSIVLSIPNLQNVDKPTDNNDIIH
jgi:hypothetical protein